MVTIFRCCWKLNNCIHNNYFCNLEIVFRVYNIDATMPLTQADVSPMNFILEAFQSEVTLDLSGNIYSEMVSALDVSAVAIMYMKTSEIKQVFQFETDATDLTNAAESDIKYYVDSAAWPKYSPANAMLDEALSLRPIATADAQGTIPHNKMMVAHDFLRYLAQQLFNTHLGVDLFNNEVELLQSIRRACDDSAAGHTVYDLVEVLKKIDLSGSSASANALLAGPDSDGKKYMTNDDTTSANVCRVLFNQMIDPSGVHRFSDILTGITSGTDGLHPQPLPFIDGDSISYKLIIHPAEGQHNLVGLTDSIGSRSFEIKIVLVDDASVVDPTDPVSMNVPVDPAEL